MFKKEKIDEKEKISFSQEQCLKTLHQKSSCSLCVDICPSKALSWSIETGVKLEYGQCIGCEACISICPTSSFQPQKINDEVFFNLLHTLSKTKPLYISCKKVKIKEDNQIQLFCLARLDFSMLLLSRSQGFEKIICVCKKCKSCEFFELSNYIDLIIQKSNYYLEQFSYVEKIEVQIVKDTWRLKIKNPFVVSLNEKGMHRRNFIKNLLYKKENRSCLEPFMNYEKLLKKNLRLQKSMKILSMTYPIDNEKLLPMLQINESLCQDCSICARVCPTDALHVMNENPFQLDFYEHKCIECKVCQDICFAKAIHFENIKPLFSVIQTTNRVLVKREKAEFCSVPVYIT